MRSLIARHRESISGLINLGGSRLLLTGISFLCSVLIARGLGAEQLGIFAMITGAFAYVSILSEFGLRTTITAETARHGNTNAALFPYIKLRLAIAAPVYSATFITTWFFFPAYLKPTAIIMLSIFFFALQIDWILIVNRKYQAAGWVSVTRWIAYLLLIVITSKLWQLSIYSLAQIFLYSWILSAAISWLVVTFICTASNPKQKAPHATTKQLLIVGTPILGSTLVSQALQNADLLWAGRFFGARDAGHYYLAISIIGAALIFANAIGQMATAQYASLRENQDKLGKKISSDSRLLFAVAAIVSAAVFLAAPLVQLVFGNEYQDSIAIIRYLVPYLILHHLWSFYFYVLIAIGQEKPLFKANLITAALIPPALAISTMTSDIQGLALAKGGILFGGILLMHLQFPKELRRQLNSLKSSHIHFLLFALGTAAMITWQNT